MSISKFIETNLCIWGKLEGLEGKYGRKYIAIFVLEGSFLNKKMLDLLKQAKIKNLIHKRAF